MKKTFPEILKNARARKGMTQKEVAQAVGIQLNSYQNYEYDKRKPTGEILLKLMKVLGLSIEEIEKASK